MKLTETQIEALYKFTRQHYVYHYDLQTELVDHLANDIEQIWMAQPHLSFEEARDKSFKKFGIFGFMDVVEAKQKQMNKRYWQIIWRFAKEWFTIPKIIITICLFFIIYYILQIPKAEYFVLIILGLALLFEMISVYKTKKLQKQKQHKNEKIFLLEAMIGTTKQFYISMTFVHLFNFFNLSNFKVYSWQNHWIFLTALILTFLAILFFITNYVIPQKAEELLQETYPEYKLVKNL